MTDKEFCKLDTAFYGEEIDHIKQIALRTFDGEELKEYVEHCIKLHLLNIHDVSNCDLCNGTGYISVDDMVQECHSC